MYIKYTQISVSVIKYAPETPLISDVWDVGL